MRRIGEVIYDVKFGSIISIDKSTNIYAGYMQEYDGNVFHDIRKIELGDFLEPLSNIKELLDKGYTYQVTYKVEVNKYCSCIFDKTEDHPVYQIENEDFVNSIVFLDIAIANSKNINNPKIKKHRLVS